LPELIDAVAEALAGGRPIAPLAADRVERDRALAALRPELPVTEPDAAVIVSTSGSTGEPKGVVLSRSAIVAAAEATHQRLGGPGRWLLALPAHYVAGLMVIARSVVAGTSVRPVGSDLSGLAAVLSGADVQPSYLSLVPTQLRRALAVAEQRTALSRVDAVVLGGAPADRELLADARAAGLRVVTTYGMSETCGGCVYDGRPLPGATVQLTDVEGDRGRIVLGGATVFSGYRLRPDLTEQTLINTELITNGVRTQDRGRLLDGRLEVLGRYDDVIISGGRKIDLAAVERAARTWPALGTGEIAVIGIPDPDWGTRLVAVAETSRTDQLLDLPTLQHHLADRIAHHEQPKQLITMPELPRTSSGKIDRQALRKVCQR
jgi:O-succinylbenzoic acid--CoA ligase